MYIYAIWLCEKRALYVTYLTCFNGILKHFSPKRGATSRLQCESRMLGSYPKGGRQVPQPQLFWHTRRRTAANKTITDSTWKEKNSYRKFRE